MSYKKFLFFVLVLFISCTINSQNPVYEATKLTDHIYKLSATGGNLTLKVIASVGDDGILLVDCGQQKGAEELKKAVFALKNETPKYIINTHGHAEHVGGNYIFGKDPIFVGHKNLRTSMRTGSYLFEGFPDEALPEITFTDSMSIFFNGEEIKLYGFPGAHDDDDILIWFTKSKIVCVGGLITGHHFPSTEPGSSSLKFGEISERIISMLPEDVMVIPGHGDDCTLADCRAFHDMIVKTTEIVKNELAKGKTIETLQKEDVLKDYQSFDGAYVDRNAWIFILANDIQNPGWSNSTDIFTPLYYTLQDKGIDSAIALMEDFKKKYDNGDGSTEGLISFIGMKLFMNNKFPESMKFYETLIKDYPKSASLYLYYYYIARNYQKMDNKELAIKNFKKSLELKPDTQKAIQYLKELEGK